ncbi:MAG TPA: hypothetical protein DE312_01440 [Gallionella sp.]|jgi:hypothetical protein|nr:MAG: hypothetical protein A3K00_09440 [Gallionellales bacterium RIFOXYD2_FULL_52_7]HCI51988.1 hypothetical protein [Gallionella sp.]
MSDSPVGYETTACELTVAFISHYRGISQLNQLNQMSDYTAPDANMLDIARSRADNNKSCRSLFSVSCVTSFKKMALDLFHIEPKIVRLAAQSSPIDH